jgi:AraC family transcriptional regulator, transcriptional activator of pobA
MQVDSNAYYTLSSYVGKSTGLGHYLIGQYNNHHDSVHHPETPHRHDYYELIWIREGSGRLKCGTSEWDFRPGSLFFSAPGRLHCWSADTQLNGDLLGFNEEFFAADADYTSLLGRMWFLHGAPCPLASFTDDALQEMNRLFTQLR